ncbi:hypothetical protein FOA52_002093 [Chlamydomonas sp. UWO 241]|nr:hypothetical protein FOA52_002093 [Chlamydomonas sp. UWO 241]
MPPERRYWKYHMQRLTTAAQHILFYVVDVRSVAILAVVGTDVRGTGHFVYSSIPDFTEAVPLRCTNRMKVMEYLAALGATDAADPDSVIVPDITPQQLELLLTSDPMFSKPVLDRQYSSWREEGGKYPDGRHWKHFIVVDDSGGAERVVVVAEDSHRRDRRYTYMAVQELGGFKLENGAAVKDYPGATPPGTTHGSPMSMSPAPAFAGEDGYGDPFCVASAEPGDLGELFRAFGGSGASWGSDPMLQALLAGGPLEASDAESLMSQLAAGEGGQHCPLQQQQQQQQQQYASHLVSATVVGAAATVATEATAHGKQHGGGGSMGARGVYGEVLLPLRDQSQSSHQPQLQLQQQQQQQQPTAQAVVDAFQDAPHLLAWISGVPDATTVTTFRAAAHSLGGLMTPAGIGGGQYQLPTAHGVRILEGLSAVPANLRLLQTTAIWPVVTALSEHTDAGVAAAAGKLAAAWKALADQAMRHAAGALARTQVQTQAHVS